MRNLYLGLIGLCLSLGVQSQSFDWAYNMGGSGLVVVKSIAVEGDGNVYSTGYYTGNSDFDQGTTQLNYNSAGSFGQTDIFVQKSDSNGNFVWAKRFGSTTMDKAYGIAVDINNDVLVTGEFENTVDFDPSTATYNLTSTVGKRAIFVLKLDSSGGFKWAKQIKASNDSRGISIVTDEKGSVYTSGFFQGINTDFNPGSGTFILHSGGSSTLGGFIQKLDSNGNFKWAKALVKYTGSGSSVISSTKLSPSGHLYSTGYFTGRVDFNPNSPKFFKNSVGSKDIFIQKMDTAGNFDWVKTIGSTNEEITTCLAVDWEDNVFTTGYFKTTLDFDPDSGIYNLSTSLAGSDPRDIFIQKLDSNGSFVWAKRIGARLADVGYSVEVDRVGNVYNTGYFSETMDFDPDFWTTATLTNSGSLDVFVQKLAPDGEFIWAKKIGAGNNDVGYCLAIDSKNDLYTGGEFYGVADFDPSTSSTFSLNSSTYQDGFVQKLNQCIPSKSIDTIVACESIVWDGVTYTSSNKSAIKSLTNSLWCDSLVFLKLTISSLDTSVTKSGATLTASLSGASYQWVNCNNSYSVISGETSKNFTPSSNGNYACVITKGSCTDTSSCFAVNVTGIKYRELNKINIFPNPVQNRMTMELVENEFIQLNIVDVSGKLVLSSTKFKTTIDLSYLETGLYSIKVITTKGILTGKFVKN